MRASRFLLLYIMSGRRSRPQQTSFVSRATAVCEYSSPAGASERPVTETYYGTKDTDLYRYMEILASPIGSASLLLQRRFF